METFLPDWLKLILLAMLAIIFAANLLGRARPHTEWLQYFKLGTFQMSDAERARRRRTSNLITGLEMILGGLALPVVYGVSTVMMFSDIDPLVASLVGAGSIALIALGIWVLWRNR